MRATVQNSMNCRVAGVAEKVHSLSARDCSPRRCSRCDFAASHAKRLCVWLFARWPLCTSRRFVRFYISSPAQATRPPSCSAPTLRVSHDLSSAAEQQPRLSYRAPLKLWLKPASTESLHSSNRSFRKPSPCLALRAATTPTPRASLTSRRVIQTRPRRCRSQ